MSKKLVHKVMLGSFATYDFKVDNQECNQVFAKKRMDSRIKADKFHQIRECCNSLNGLLMLIIPESYFSDKLIDKSFKDLTEKDIYIHAVFKYSSDIIAFEYRGNYNFIKGESRWLESEENNENNG